jgi:antitoxin YefM
MQAVSVSQFRTNIKKYLDSVSQDNDVLIVPRNSDDDGVVIISLREYNSMMETVHLLSTEANRHHLKTSIQQLESGDVKIWKPE